MKLYSIKKGKYYFKGDKWQPVYLQYGLTLSCIIAAITLVSWWFILGGALVLRLVSNIVLAAFVYGAGMGGGGVRT